MTKRQLMIFKKQLIELKASIETAMLIEKELDIMDKEIEEADETDKIEKNNIIDFQAKRNEYQQRLLKEINHALRKIENKTFGICEETGEEITIERLKANPIARYSLEAQILMENSN